MKKIELYFLFFSIFFICNFSTFAQKQIAIWDNISNKQWGIEFKRVEINSTVDSTLQKAWFYQSAQIKPQPLIVSLHTWSGDYNQEDPLAKEILLRDWNYIHPDFRGPNNNPNACGSTLVITDIEDAIRFAVKNGNVDRKNVHIIGVSGGGHATLMAYMKINYPVKSFNAWVGISNLSDWYWESKDRNVKYANDLEQIAMNGNQMNWTELESRSPIKLPFIAAKRKNASLNIYAGVHDGYNGSVPISHSILFYNKIAALLYPKKKNNLVNDYMLKFLLSKQTNPNADTTLCLGGRKIHLIKKMPHLSLTIFEGGHEMLVSPALALPSIDKSSILYPLQILTIGDSNGAFEYGWPEQMKKLMPFATIVNKSIAGNTIGFDNLDQPKLNTITNINKYLDDALVTLGKGRPLDYIFINLGTNDSKNAFKERQSEIAPKMDALIHLIKHYLEEKKIRQTKICIISPSPIDEQKIDTLKYGGGACRIEINNTEFKNVALKNNIDYLDSYSFLKKNFSIKTIDGIHLNEKTQFELASIICTYINKKQKK